MLRFAPDAPLTQRQAGAAAQPPLRRYRVEPADQLILRPLDDLTLLYHRRSGQTHMVVSPVPEIIAALDGPAPMTVDDVLARLSQDYDPGDRDEALSALGQHLEELTALGVVRRV